VFREDWTPLTVCSQLILTAAFVINEERLDLASRSIQ